MRALPFPLRGGVFSSRRYGTFMKRFIGAVAYAAFRCAVLVARFVPLRLLLWNATCFGTLLYWLNARYGKVAYKNLTIAFGDSMSDAEKRLMVKRVFQFWARFALAELPYGCGLSKERLKKHCYLDSADYKRLQDYVEAGRGIIVLSGHFGCFELGARRIAAEGKSFAIVARIGNDGPLRRVYDDMRTTGGYEVFERGEAVRKIIKFMHEARAVAILPDQKSDEVYVPFFGQLLGSVAGPAVLALRTGAAIVPLFIVRQPDGTHRAVLYDDIDTRSTGDFQRDVARIMTDYNAVLEDIVRKHPEQYFWLHDRWRSKPPPEVQAQWEQAQAQASLSGGC